MGDHVARGVGCDLLVEEIGDRFGQDPQHRVGLRDHIILRQGDGCGDGGAGAARGNHRVNYVELAAFQREFDLHFFAQTSASNAPQALQFIKYIRLIIFKGWAARILGQIHRVALAAERVAGLRLAFVAASVLRFAGGGIDELDDACTAFALAQTKRHALDHQPETGFLRRAFGHAQQPRGRAFPGSGHGFEHFKQLNIKGLREFLVHLLLVGIIGVFDAQVGLIEHIIVQPGDFDGVGADEFQMQCTCSIGT